MFYELSNVKRGAKGRESFISFSPRCDDRLIALWKFACKLLQASQVGFDKRCICSVKELKCVRGTKGLYAFQTEVRLSTYITIFKPLRDELIPSFLPSALRPRGECLCTSAVPHGHLRVTYAGGTSTSTNLVRRSDCIRTRFR